MRIGATDSSSVTSQLFTSVSCRWSLTKRGLSRRLEQWPAGATAESEASRDPDAGARAQMAILQARQCDVGFSALPLPQHRISIVGGRPFSKASTYRCNRCCV